MENLVNVLMEYAAKLNFPGIGVIDVVEIFLISFLSISSWCGSNSRGHILC